MKIANLRTNHLVNPLGYHLEAVTLGWTVEETASTSQVAARVVVATDEGFSSIGYDSGETGEISGIACRVDMRLEPRTRYYWKVWVKGDAGDEAWSDTAWFETAKMEEPWRADWVESPLGGAVHPLMQHRFSLESEVASARVYACGLGLYELYLNGEKVGDEVLAPFYNSYDNWLQYQTYDVTAMLQKGANGVGAMLGNGWYKGVFGFGGSGENIYGDSFLLRLELVIRYADGTEQIVGTGADWLCAPAPVTASGIYLGEHYDARAATPGFATADCDLSGFTTVRVVSPNLPLEERRSPPLRVIETRTPVELINTPAGETVLDFGQVLSGWVECQVDLPAGQTMRLQHGELLQNDNFYTENLRFAQQEYRYVSDGVPRKVRPHFTFYGFRYLKVEGLAKVNPADFTACVIHSDLEFTGSIKVDNPKVQKLVENALWGQRGNFVDVPTDCPQRDERMGWTGDAQVFAPTACFNMDCAAFFDKYMYDLNRDQALCNGAVPHVVPDLLRHLPWNLGYNEEGVPAGSCAWGDAATVIPWTLYQFYGDKAMLARHYPGMKSWVGYIRRQDDANGGARLWRTGFHFADWLALDNPNKESSFGRTDNAFVASCYYLYSTELTAKAARALGSDDEAGEYEALAAEIRAAIQAEFFTPGGRLAVDTQTAHVIALFFNVAPDTARARTVQDLAQLLRASNDHLDTGFVGTAYLCKVLSAAGLNALAYTLLLNEDFPSWLYEINMGATTVWERWNSVLPNGLVSDTGMNSMNHYAYGAVVEWMYRYMCGLNPAAPGFAKAAITPMPDARIPAAEACYRSAAGTWRSGWQAVEGGYLFKVTVPFGATAEFKVPGTPKALALNGDKTAEPTILLASGTHVIEAAYA
ncbi:glycoside hydrolase family 78 protein [Ruminococcaceae bacterium OttesenSCG-928-D13]|nr:glycoside hydrolase family 78 protein [Ruminococcaceae bacterium OttesenSCG-928-D13]